VKERVVPVKIRIQNEYCKRKPWWLAGRWYPVQYSEKYGQYVYDQSGIPCRLELLYGAKAIAEVRYNDEA
jgi:hypothetical protein